MVFLYKNKNIMKCPLCDKKTNLKHLNNCKYNLQNLSQKELRKLFIG